MLRAETWRRTSYCQGHSRLWLFCDYTLDEPREPRADGHRTRGLQGFHTGLRGYASDDEDISSRIRIRHRNACAEFLDCVRTRRTPAAPMGSRPHWWCSSRMPKPRRNVIYFNNPRHVYVVCVIPRTVRLPRIVTVTSEGLAAYAQTDFATFL